MIRHLQLQVHTAFFRHHGHRIHDTPQQLYRIKRLLLQRHLAGVNLGNIQHIIHHVGQTLGRIQDDIDTLVDVGRHHILFDAFLQTTAETQNRTERRAHFVIHVGEEAGALGVGLFQRLIEIAGLLQTQAQLQQIHHMTGQGLQCHALVWRQFTWFHIDGAQRAYRKIVRRNQRRTGIEADAGIFQHQRIIRETGITGGIRHHHHIVLQNGMGTERQIAMGFLSREPHFRLEPLAVAIHQTHQGNRRFANGRQQGGYGVEIRLCRRIQNTVTLQRFEAFLFIGRTGGNNHDNSVGRVNALQYSSRPSAD